MKTAFAKQTKRNTYIKLDKVIYRTNNKFSDREFELSTKENTNSEQWASIESKYDCIAKYKTGGKRGHLTKYTSI